MNRPVQIIELAGSELELVGCRLVSVRIEGDVTRIRIEALGAPVQVVGLNGHHAEPPAPPVVTPSPRPDVGGDPLTTAGSNGTRNPMPFDPVVTTPSTPVRGEGVTMEGGCSSVVTPAAAVALAHNRTEQEGLATASCRPPAPLRAPGRARARAGAPAHGGDPLTTDAPSLEPCRPPRHGEAVVVDPVEAGGSLTAELAALAEQLRRAIRHGDPTADPVVEPWMAELRRAVTMLDGQGRRFTPRQLAQAAWFAHGSRDRFWRPLVRSGRTLRRYGWELLDQRNSAGAADKGPEVPCCARCDSLCLSAPDEVPISCGHGVVWYFVRPAHCERCGEGCPAGRAPALFIGCEGCRREGLPRGAVAEPVLRSVAALGLQLRAATGS